MKLTAGEIYFVGERDLKTNEQTPYVKIGIVRDNDKGPRSSEARLLEHQTGNPRELFLHSVIKTPVVEQIETTMHGIYAPLRVNGEWIQLNDEELHDAIAQVERMRDQAIENSDVFQEAERLKTVLSNDDIRTPGSTEDEWFVTYNNAKIILKECKTVGNLFKKVMQEAIAADEQVSHIAKTQTRSGYERFDIEAFESTHPDLFAKYQITTSNFSQRFTVITPKKWGENLASINEDFAIEIAKFNELVSESGSPKEAIHLSFLRLRSHEAQADWDKTIAENRLKALCGEASAIQGICTWPRKSTERTSFDEAKLLEDFPDLHSQFLVTTDEVEAIIIDPKQGYGAN